MMARSCHSHEIPENHHFSYSNLAYGIFTTLNNQKRRPGVTLGDYVLDLTAVKNYFTGRTYIFL